MDENEYRLEELAEVSGVSPRTVRYYTAEGLLPAPDARGRVVLYTDAHLRRLALIGRLKEAYFPLEDIKRQLDALTDEEVTALLATAGTPTFSGTSPPPAAPSPAPAAAPLAPAAAAPRPKDDAVSYIARVLARQTAGKTKNQPAAPAGAASAEPAPEIWQRVTLAPGVELHVRRIDKFVAQIIEYAKTLQRQP